MWFHELEVYTNATAVVRFGLEPAEDSNEKISCSKNSFNGQTPLQLEELSGKQSLHITAQEIWAQSPES